MKLEEYCRSCNSNCCKEWTIFITIDDAIRIQNFTMKNVDEFASFSEVPEWELKKYKNKGYNHIYSFLVNDKILQLKKNKNDCIFLANGLCSIYRVRPMICRLYPFWFEKVNNSIKINICIGYENVYPIPLEEIEKYKKLKLEQLIMVAEKYHCEIEYYKKNILDFVNSNYAKK